MGEIETGIFCSVEDVLKNLPGSVPFWKLNGWVYRGGSCRDWLHEDYYHKTIPWWNLKERIRHTRKIYMGYANCNNYKCIYCGEEVPDEVKNKIMDAVIPGTGLWGSKEIK